MTPHVTPHVPTDTVGWQPSCKCPEHEPIPCAVADIFSGSGTSGLVAQRLGRSFVGIELSETYVPMSRRRIIGDAPLWNHAAEEAAGADGRGR